MTVYTVGFTGTQDGMTFEQEAQFKEVINGIWVNNIEYGDYSRLEFHHGDCIGADAKAHDLWRHMFSGMDERIVIHPPINDSKRAFKHGDLVLQEYDYLERNRNIVNASMFLIATPKTINPTRRGGTWYTVRYAATHRVDGVVITPDGVWTNLSAYSGQT